jgi:hypothetical protein
VMNSERLDRNDICEERGKENRSTATNSESQIIRLREASPQKQTGC